MLVMMHKKLECVQTFNVPMQIIFVFFDSFASRSFLLTFTGSLTMSVKSALPFLSFSLACKLVLRLSKILLVMKVMSPFNLSRMPKIVMEMTHPDSPKKFVMNLKTLCQNRTSDRQYFITIYKHEIHFVQTFLALYCLDIFERKHVTLLLVVHVQSVSRTETVLTQHSKCSRSLCHLILN